MMSFDDMLARCLSDVEAGQSTIEECLQRYPEQAAALQPLLRTATALRNLPDVAPAPAFAAAAPARMMNLIAARRPVAQSTPALPQPAAQGRRWGQALLKVAVACVLAVAMISGTAYAARDSMPDSPLYQVKRTVETVQAAAARGDVRRARVFVAQMDKRALETAALLRAGKLERARETTAAYLRLLHSAELAAGRVPIERSDGRMALLYVRERLLVQQDVFLRVQANAPERSRLLLRPTLNAIERALVSVNARLAE